MGERNDEIAALVALLRRRKAGWNEIAAEVSFGGSAAALLRELDGDALFSNPELDDAVAQAAADIQAWHAVGLRFVTVMDDDYPARLLDIHETPPFLFYKGDLRREDAGVSLVGSRSVSDWGKEFAEAAARSIVQRGLTVISGLAAGVDTAAHRATLDAGGRTVAFIGTGINRAYPAQNADLQDEIASRGLILSQFYPDAPPTKHSFPIRNAAMSGYGLASVIVEAGEHSGARIQARVAGQHGRPVILTSRVVDATDWGKALSHDPNVNVVSTVEELAAVLDFVVARPHRVDDALRALA